MFLLSLPKDLKLSSEPVISQWLVSQGDNVQAAQKICVIKSASENFELESSVSGVVLKILAEAGWIIDKSDALAIIGEKGQDISKVIEQINALKQEPQPVKKKEEITRPAVMQDKPVVETQINKSSGEKTMSLKPAGKVIPILMPQAGQSMEEGTILSWKVKEGDRIEVGQVIMEIETDKANMDVEAVDAGRIAKIVAQEGDIIEIKQPVAYLAENDLDLEAITKTDTAAETIVKEPAPQQIPDTPQPTVAEGAVVPVLMPQAGQSMEEGTILSWKVKEGDRIEVGQVIMEIETDKANMDVEAVDAGRIAKIVAQEGDIVEIKQPVAYLAENDADAEAYLSAQSAEEKTAEQAQPAATKEKPEVSAPRQTAPAVSTGGRVKASPAAKRLAKEKGVDLSTVSEGSGPGGRIVSADIELIETAQGCPKKIPLTKMRKAIAKNLLYSKQNIPHFYAKCTVDAAEFFALYRKTKEQFKCTVNDFVTAACAKTIAQYPVFRSQYRDNEIVEFPSVNIGIAVGTENGLTVPVLLDADKLPLKELAANSRKLIENARNGVCDNLGKGVFTITNLGMFGIEEFTAIINPPESALLSVGAIRDGVTVVDGQVKATKLMTMVLSIDHRVIDGVMGAQFMQMMKELLENPQQLVQ